MTYTPDTPSPPGDTLRDWMEENGVGLHGMAGSLGVDPATMQRLLDGHALINHWLAQSLFCATEIPAEFWLNREREYRERLKRK